MQIEKIYEKLGDPLDNFSEVKSYPLYNDFKPKKKYRFCLDEHLKMYSSELGYDFIDLIKKMLDYNPANRISAEEALSHEFFINEPKICHKSEFPSYKQEYHYLLLKNIANSNNEQKFYYQNKNNELRSNHNNREYLNKRINDRNHIMKNEESLKYRKN